MPRTSSASIDEIIRSAVAPVVERASAAIAKAIAELAQESISHELGRSMKRVARRRGRRASARARRDVEMTEWSADRRARRVPKFVIEATGLDTKKKIVARFGENVTFHKGKPLPPAKAPAGEAGASSSARQVAAKPPRIRKAAGG
jgi:hypothetical protein